MYQVVKRDGSLQPFDENKVLNAVKSSGGSDDEAGEVLKAVQAWLTTVAKNNKVKSLDIRDKVLEELDSLNPDVAESFRAYVKP